MTVVWVLLGVVVVISAYVLLKVMKKLNRTMALLVDSMGELGEVATELQRLRSAIQEQNGSVDDNRIQ